MALWSLNIGQNCLRKKSLRRKSVLVEEAKERVERRMLLENNGNMKRLTDSKSDDSE